jgi:hypothetical protein
MAFCVSLTAHSTKLGGRSASIYVLLLQAKKKPGATQVRAPGFDGHNLLFKRSRMGQVGWVMCTHIWRFSLEWENVHIHGTNDQGGAA